MTTTDRPGICVLGMHRSGTSVTASVLEELGVSLGDEGDLMPEHREHREIVRIDDDLLREAGGTWDSPPPRPALTAVLDAPADELRERATAVLEQLARRQPWGFKDPRASLTWPFWQEIANLTPVVCVREPMAVARSLERRDRFPLAKGIWLWAVHLAASLDGTVRDPLLILYDDLLADPHRTVTRVVRRLRLEPPSDGAERAADVVRGGRAGPPGRIDDVGRAAREAYDLVSAEGMGAAMSALVILQELDEDLRPRFGESWERRTERMLETVVEAVPDGSLVALVDDGSLSLPSEVRGTRVLRLHDLPGAGGPPEDDDGAAARFAQVRDAGASHVAVSWTSSWWLDHYPTFADAARSGGLVLNDERVALFAVAERQVPSAGDGDVGGSQ